MSYQSLVLTVTVVLLGRSVMAQEENPPPEFPVEPILFMDEPFNSCEGLAFNGEGQMYVTCNQGLWRVTAFRSHGICWQRLGRRTGISPARDALDRALDRCQRNPVGPE